MRILTTPLLGMVITSDPGRFGACRGVTPDGHSLTGPGPFPNGCAPSIGGRMHEGIDGNVADATAMVRSIAPGVVDSLQKSDVGAAGKMVVLNHGVWGAAAAQGHLFSSSMHLDWVCDSLKVGRFVFRGEPLGEYGDTGNSSAEHLHIKLALGQSYATAKPFDPEPWLLPTIRPGQKHPYVGELKGWLVALGFANGIGNVADRYTAVWVPRVKAAQVAFDLTPDGVIGQRTLFEAARRL